MKNAAFLSIDLVRERERGRERKREREKERERGRESKRVSGEDISECTDCSKRNACFYFLHLFSLSLPMYLSLISPFRNDDRPN